MMSNKQKILLIILLLASFLGGLFASINKTDSNVSLKSIDSLPDLDKNIRNSKEWIGKIVVANHWASWCGPCRNEIPHLINLANSYKDQDVAVIGIAHDTLENAKAFAASIGMNYPSLLAVQNGSDILSQHGNGKTAIPLTVIFDRQGIRVAIISGETDFNTIDHEIKKIEKNITYSE